ncbi:hypothetical protein ACSBR2_034613 [Camellia fascicularis]
MAFLSLISPKLLRSAYDGTPKFAKTWSPCLLKFFPVFFRLSGRFDGVWCVGSFTRVALCGPLSIEDPSGAFRIVKLGLTMSWAGPRSRGPNGF